VRGIKNNNNHVNMYYDLSQRSERDHEFLVKIITGDETCVHGYDQESSQETSQSNRTTSPCPNVARQVCSNANSIFGFADIHLRSNVKSVLSYVDIHLTCAMWICFKRTYPKPILAHWHHTVAAGKCGTKTN
jgi:hypothetical protein